MRCCLWCVACQNGKAWPSQSASLLIAGPTQHWRWLITPAFASSGMMTSNTYEVSAKEEKKTALLRRHSTGEHAFFPDKQFRQAQKAASQRNNFGVDDNHVHDGEVRSIAFAWPTCKECGTARASAQRAERRGQPACDCAGASSADNSWLLMLHPQMPTCSSTRVNV